MPLMAPNQQTPQPQDLGTPIRHMPSQVDIVATTFGPSDSNPFNLHETGKATKSGSVNGQENLVSIQVGPRGVGQTQGPDKDKGSGLMFMEADHSAAFPTVLHDNP